VHGAAHGGRAELNGVPLPISKVVESETSVRPLLDRLLGSTCIVRDLGAATAAWRETQGAFHYVTLTGEILSSHGIYTGGYQNGNGNGKAPASILGRRNQIAELKSAVTALHESVTGISRRKGGLQSEQTELQMKPSFQQQHNALELRIRELSHVIEQRRGELITFVTRREQAQREMQESRLEIDRLSHDREQVNAQTGELVGQKQAQEAEIGGREEALREERRRLSEFQQQRGTIE